MLNRFCHAFPDPITVQSNQKCLLKGAVVLDEYYYARKKPCPEEGQFTETKGNFLFKVSVPPLKKGAFFMHLSSFCSVPSAKS